MEVLNFTVSVKLFQYLFMVAVLSILRKVPGGFGGLGFCWFFGQFFGCGFFGGVFFCLQKK